MIISCASCVFWGRALVQIGLVFLSLLQLYLLNLCYLQKAYKRLILNLLPMAVTFFLAILLMWQQHQLHDDSFVCCVFVPAMLIVMLYGYTLMAIRKQRRASGEMLTVNSVRDACDNFPFGLCFFASNELPVLCNRQMSLLARELAGKHIQSLGELRKALEQPAPGVTVLTIDNQKHYQLADGRQWYFTETKIEHTGSRSYIQVTATEHTELNRLNAELKLRNRELKRMMVRLRRTNANIADIVREQEILTAKMRIHNKMGNCLMRARSYFMQDCPPEKKAELLDCWMETVAALQGEIRKEEDTAPASELISLAAKMDVEIAVHGEMPDNPALEYLFVVVLRECLTNAIRHASASRIDLSIFRGNGCYTGVYKNNGTPPDGEIMEGGGLKSLRSRLEHVGGTMAIRSRPAFQLTVILPETLKQGEDDSDDECTDCGR